MISEQFTDWWRKLPREAKIEIAAAAHTDIQYLYNLCTPQCNKKPKWDLAQRLVLASQDIGPKFGVPAITLRDITIVPDCGYPDPVDLERMSDLFKESAFPSVSELCEKAIAEIKYYRNLIGS